MTPTPFSAPSPLGMRLLCLLSFLVLAPLSLWSQGTVFSLRPSVLYPGRNIISIKVPAGLASINVVSATPNLELEGDGTFDCVSSTDLDITLYRADKDARVNVELVDCRGRRDTVELAINHTWELDLRDYGAVPVGRRTCMMFYIRSEDRITTLDTVTVSDPHVSINFFTKLPYRIIAGVQYEYEVCFEADEPGAYRFPVVTWMRRDDTANGFTSYPVSDTGIAFVPEPPVIPVSDPTTFRSVVVPNAVIPPKGTLAIGSYDVLGLIASYSVTDNVMLYGGLVVPMPDDWVELRGESSTALSVGAKAGMSIGDNVDVAVGYQVAASGYQKQTPPTIFKSDIFVQAPWAAISYGDDDSRASMTLSYAFKHHTTTDAVFDENVFIAAFGGDYRLANNWKVAGEVAYMEKLGVLPIIATARYFTDTYALDAGLAFVGITLGDAKAPAIPIAPVISAIFVF